MNFMDVKNTFMIIAAKGFPLYALFIYLWMVSNPAVRTVRKGNRLHKEVVELLSLAVFKKKLDKH